MTFKQEKRFAARVRTNLPTVVEVIPRRDVALHPNLAQVYERVTPSEEMVGKKFPGIVRDLSTNGAFIAGVAVPLLSRVVFTFPLDGHGQVEVLGWVLWRRTGPCTLPQPNGGDDVTLDAGFGVLFEAIPLEARQIIARLVSERG